MTHDGRSTASVALEGRVAIVTGAARGMGYAHAEALAARGAHVVLVDRDDVVVEAAERIRRAGGGTPRAVAVTGDITREWFAEELVQSVTGEFGRVDVLVHNAGLMHDWRNLAETAPGELDRYLAVNVVAPYALTRAAAPLLRRSSAGRVIFISSQWGQVPDGHSYGYMVSKAAQLGLMKALAKEFVADRVLVNAIAPGAVRTRMVPAEAHEEEVAAVPLGRLGEPEEIAAAVAFLASDDAAFITGQVLPINGGALVVGI